MRSILRIRKHHVSGTACRKQKSSLLLIFKKTYENTGLIN